jgi:hypothetical protein
MVNYHIYMATIKHYYDLGMIIKLRSIHLLWSAKKKVNYILSAQFRYNIFDILAVAKEKKQN